jgi:hypothetical protein
MIDYTIFYKKELPPIRTDWSKELRWDIFISAYTSSERVRSVFEKVNASEKHWLLFPEYHYTQSEFPPELSFPLNGDCEAMIMQPYLEDNKIKLGKGRICIDTTGFIRPYLIFLLRWLVNNKIYKFDALYSEPSLYAMREKTQFSDEIVTQVRQVQGYEGIHTTETLNDLLIIGSGYDHEPIAQVAESKDHAKKIQVFGLPSLRPDMYQENVLRAQKAAEAVGVGSGDESPSFFSPAYDPFVTANVLHDIVARQEAHSKVTNLYLCPLATKPQVLGFALYYLTERANTATSIIYPFSKAYSRETSKGIARVWHYTVELPQILKSS